MLIFVFYLLVLTDGEAVIPPIRLTQEGFQILRGPTCIKEKETKTQRLDTQTNTVQGGYVIVAPVEACIFNKGNVCVSPVVLHRHSDMYRTYRTRTHHVVHKQHEKHF